MKLVIFTDGGSRGNPGIAGSGTVIYNENHEVIETIADYLGNKLTNNVAEYQGLINGLEAAARRGASEVAVFMDSKLVVNQMNGTWKIKHADMQKKAITAKDLEKQIGKVTYEWVPRAKNKRADELANEAMDARETFHHIYDDAQAEAEQYNPEPSKVVDGGRQEEILSIEPLILDFDAEEEKTKVETKTKAEATAEAPKFVAPVTDASEPRSVKLIVVRHGQTDCARDSIYSGSGTDIPLNEVGFEQVKRAARYVKAHDMQIDALIASPMLRTQQTAKALAAVVDLPIINDERIIEINFGEWEGKSVAEVHKANPKNHGVFLSDPAVPAPGGESCVEMYERVRGFRDWLFDNYAGKTVLLATHSGPTRVLLALAANLPADQMRRFAVDTASVNIVEFWEDGGSVVHESNGGKVF